MPKSYYDRYLGEQEKKALAKAKKEQCQAEQREAKARARAIAKEGRERQRAVAKEVKRQLKKRVSRPRKARKRPQSISDFGFKKKKQGKPLSRKGPIRLL